MTISVGTQIGSYQVTAFIGEGGMGRVFRAHDTELMEYICNENNQGERPAALSVAALDSDRGVL